MVFTEEKLFENKNSFHKYLVSALLIPTIVGAFLRDFLRPQLAGPDSCGIGRSKMG